MEELLSTPEEKKLSFPEEKLLQAPSFWEKYSKFLWLTFPLLLILILISFFISTNKTPNPSQPPQTLAPTQPLPTPTADPTANWKTYRNEKYGFELKYPRGFYFQEGNYVVSSTYSLRNDKREYWIEFADLKWKDQKIHNQSLIIDLIKTDLSPKEYLDKIGSYGSMLDNTCTPEAVYCSLKSIKNTNIRIDKMPVLQFYSAAASGSDNHTFVKGKEYIVDIHAHSSGNGNFPEDIYNQILSNFKFLDQEQAIDMTNWKTFSGLGISFKYPSNYNIDQTNSTGGYIALYSPIDPNRQPVGEVQENELKLEIIVESAGQNDTLNIIFNDVESNIKTMAFILDKKDIIINNTPAKYLKTYQVEEYVLLVDGKKIFIMKYPVSTSRQSEFNQILSTFKFTQ